MQVNRRQFLSHGLGTLVALNFPNFLIRSVQAAAPKYQDTWLLVGDNRDPELRASDCLVAYHIASGELKVINMAFPPHSTLQHPLRKQLFDLQKKQIIKDIKPQKNCSFYGHGTFFNNGKQFVSIEVDERDYRGRLVIRDSSTFEIQGDFDSFGIAPHECKLLPDHSTLAVANCGFFSLRKVDEKSDYYKKITTADSVDSSVSLIDLKTGVLKKKYRVTFKDEGVGHLAVASSGEIVGACASAPVTNSSNLGHVLISNEKEEMTAPDFSKSSQKIEFKGQVLSLCLNEKYETAIATSPEANFVTAWNYKTKQLKKKIDLNQALGVTITEDQEHFLFSTNARELIWFNAKTLEREPELEKEFKFGDGAHLLLATL